MLIGKKRTLMIKKTFLLVSFLSVMLLAACSRSSSTPTVAPDAGRQAEPIPSTGNASIKEQAELPADTVNTGVEPPGTPELSTLINILGNLSYTGVFPDRPIALKNGYYAYSEGGSGKPHVSLVERLISTGDLNADGEQDAIFMLEDDSEGSGRLTFMVAVLSVYSDPKPVEAVILGGRSGVESLAVDGSQVVVDIVTHGPGDADCCASWNVQAVYSLEDDRLVEKSRTERNQISLEDLDGTRWRLVDLGDDQQAKQIDSEITLHFNDGQISGFAGCNDYSGAVSSGDYGLNSINVSLTSTTGAICSEPASAQETAYLSRLTEASSWRYDYSYLSLLYKVDEDTNGELLFAPEAQAMKNTNHIKPDSIIELEGAYGQPSQAGFGSAVFYEQEIPGDDLEKAALEKYRFFVGELWERFGEEAWMGSWKEVYARKPDIQHNIVSELGSIQDAQAAISVPMILENIESADKAQAALSAVYNVPAVTDLRVYSLGDGGAMSGLLIAGRNSETGEAIFLVFLLD